MKIIKPEDLKVLSIPQLKELSHDIELVLYQKEMEEFDKKANNLLDNINEFLKDFPNALFIVKDEERDYSYEVPLEQIVKIAYDENDIES